MIEDADPTVDETVAASEDDCYFHGAGPTFLLDYVALNCGRDSENNPIGGGMRFTSVNIPQGATITAAYLTLQCQFGTATTPVNTNIDGEDVDDAAAFSDWANYSGRARTTALVPWDGIGAWVTDTSYNSPSIVSILQEIINRPGWVPNNDLVIFWEDDVSNVNTFRSTASWDHLTLNPPKLHIEYTVLGAYGIVV